MASGRAWQTTQRAARPEPTQDNDSPHPGEIVAAFVAAFVAIGTLWFISDIGGAVGVARADDWSYLLTQFEFAETGQFVMNNWAVTMLIGQTLIAAPIVAISGPSIAAMQMLVAALSVAALVATYTVVRQVLTRAWSAFAVITLAFSPVFGPSVVSFMTDIPSLLFLSLSLLLGIQALRGPSVRWYPLLASGLLALIAFTFRDYAIIGFPAVIIVGLLLHKDRRTRVVLAAVLAVIGALALALYLWRHSLPNDLRLPGWDLAYSIQLVARGALTIALLVAPALAAITWWRVKAASMGRTVLLYSTAAGVAAVTLGIAGFELLGNVIHPFATSWLVSGSGVRLWPLWINRLIIVAALVCLTLLLALAWKIWSNSRGDSGRMAALVAWTRNSPARAVVVLFPTILLIAHSGATILLGTWYIDRYFILIIPFLVAALLRVAIDKSWITRGAQVAIPGFFLLVFTGVGLHVVDFNARFDGARWAIGEQLVAEGYKATEIDAGVEWVTFHAKDIGEGPQQRDYQPDRTWWTERYPNQSMCVTVSAIDASSVPSEDEPAVVLVSTLFGREYSLVARPGPDSCP